MYNREDNAMAAARKVIRTTSKRKPNASALAMPAEKRKRVDDIMKKRVDAVVEAAKRSGLIGEKSGRIAGRVSPALVEEAKKLTGLASDTDLLEFALANVAVKDDFPDAFRKLKGTVDPTLDLEF
jgi:hypothetical protein